jgi:hypothetical protein
VLTRDPSEYGYCLNSVARLYQRVSSFFTTTTSRPVPAAPLPLPTYFQHTHIYNHVWTRQRRQRSRKVNMPFQILYCSGDVTDHGEYLRGGAKRHRKILRDNIQGITKVCIPLPFFSQCSHILIAPDIAACYPSSCSPWWCQAYLRPYLRRDPWCPQDFLGECTYDLIQLHTYLTLYFDAGNS